MQFSSLHIIIESKENKSKNMKEDLTLSIIKPNAVRNKKIGEIISLFEKSNLTIKKAKLTTLAKDIRSLQVSCAKDKKLLYLTCWGFPDFQAG